MKQRGVSVALIGGTLPLVTCLDPTEVRVTVHTNVCDLHDVEIVLENGAAAVAHKTLAPDPACDPTKGRRVGDLVFVPSAGPRRVRFQVNGARLNGDCASNPPRDCVIARRSVGYVDHAALTLPVELDLTCVGIPCPVGTTCDRGVCVSDDVSCRVTTCGLADASANVPDATGPCVAPVIGGLTGSPWYWSFDGVDPSPVLEAMTKTSSTLLPGVSRETQITRACGAGLVAGVAQPLGVGIPSAGVGFSFFVFIKPGSMGGELVRKHDTTTTDPLQGISVRIDANSLVVRRCEAFGACYDDVSKLLVPGQWYTVEASIKTNDVIAIAVDGVKLTMLSGNANPTTFRSGTISVGPAPGVVLDELRVFAVQ
jgi:hypothetical protein